jgi:hypothetical protein
VRDSEMTHDEAVLFEESRGQAASIAGSSERQARRVVSALLAKEVLVSYERLYMPVLDHRRSASGRGRKPRVPMSVDRRISEVS